MSDDIHEYCKVLKNWSSQECTKKITDILLRIQKLTSSESDQDIHNILEIMGNFHKQITKAKAENVENQWFKQVIKAKNYVKNLIEEQKKSKLPKIIKRDSQIEYPEQQWQGKSQQYKEVAKSLYKHFLINMEEEVSKEKNKIAEFLDQIIVHLFDEFDFGKEQVNKIQSQTSELFTRVNLISKQLAKASAVMLKNQILQGKIQAKRIAIGDSKAFISIEQQKIRQERLDALIKENSTGFYDEMKKDINKDANQQCRFCKKKAAYCEGQKQIRAADQPMTRFMVCNLCNKRWRQQ